jgi:hypothetical protein
MSFFLSVFFFNYYYSTKSENRMAEQVFPGWSGLFQWEGRGGKERGWESEGGTKNEYTCM